MEGLVAWGVLLAGLAFVAWVVRSENKRRAEADPSDDLESTGPAVSADERPIHNPANLVAFLIAELDQLSSLEDVYSKLHPGFEDISAEDDVAEEWRDLGLQDESAHMLRFSTGPGTGELEVVFSEGRLVQAGVQVFGTSADCGPVAGTFKLAGMFINQRFAPMQVGPSHIAFGDGRYNGYLRIIRIPGGASATFRLADLAWCERIYGPNSEFSLS